MKTLIVDDEPLARRELRTLLAAHPEFTVEGEAGNVTEALALLQTAAYDLILLDIQMPERTGFDLVEQLPRPHPQIIFVTAYDQFALRAFEVNALDYLMKPVNPDRLASALQKVQSNRSEKSPTPENATALRRDDRVFLKEADRCFFIPVKEMRLLESDGNHTIIHFGTNKATLYRTLNSMEARLPSSLFLRANRSQIINLHHVREIVPWFSGCLKVKLQTGEEIELSRRQSQLFRDLTSL